MRKLEDDTTKPPDGSRTERERPPRRSYYYDDATGYEIYKPDDDDEGDARADVENHAGINDNNGISSPNEH